MEYFKEFEVKVETECVIRSCNECDGNDVLEVLGTLIGKRTSCSLIPENRLLRRSIV